MKTLSLVDSHVVVQIKKWCEIIKSPNFGILKSVYKYQYEEAMEEELWALNFGGRVPSTSVWNLIIKAYNFDSRIQQP